MLFVLKLSVKLLLNSLLLTAILCQPGNALGVDCSKHTIYCSILEINPRAKDAMRLSNYLYTYSKKYQTDPLLSVAIIAQESMFRNIVSGDDWGLYQFHIQTLEYLNLDKFKLLTNLKYATKSHIKLLRRKIRKCTGKFKNPWVCYHSATPVHAKKYEQKVLKYYNRIKEKNDE